MDLTYLRERIGKTQQQVADELDTSKATISNWEAEPEKLSLEKLRQYLLVVGASLSDFSLEEDKNGNSIIIKPNRELFILRKKLENGLKTLEKLKIEKGYDTPAFEEVSIQILRDLKKLQVVARKARLLIVGPSDAGKSTLINQLLGDKIVPSHWTPATGMAIKILHSTEKPEWLVGNTIIVKEDIRSDNELVESWKLRDKNYYDEHVQIEGTREIVEKYGEREGSNYKQDIAQNETIFTYVDAPILNAIEIWDTPGTGAGDDAKGQLDEKISTDVRNNADAVVYMMTANQFMRTSDYPLLKRDIEKLPLNFNDKLDFKKLPNLFVVASQADIIETERDRNLILQNGFKSFAQSLPDEFFSNLGINVSDLGKRFFTISSKKREISNSFNSCLEKFVNESQNIIYKEAAFKVQDMVNFHMKNMELVKTNISNERNNHEKLVADATLAEKKLNDIIETNEKNSQKLKDEILNARRKAKREFENSYLKIMNKDNLLSMIDEGGFKKSKEQRQAFAHKISNILDAKYESILKKRSEDFKKASEKILKQAQVNSGISTHTFNFTAAFSGLVASGVTLGAFAVIAAGISSNLGLYILVAQVGGLLTSAGIISSPVLATTTVATLGGPVGWIIGITVIAGTLVGITVGLFNKDTWKIKFSNQLIDGFKKEKVLQQYLDAIDKFMDETNKGIDKIKKGSDLVAKENVKILQNKAKASSGFFEKSIEQVNDWRENFENQFSSQS